ncbi:YaiI/YqxD family protein [Shouchella lonarensis]|uniref:UPF0178 protein SAMN05421737_10767 n=1 Tax=Shouchella lonarensis TaxID=1464122 RepID=A0A1G6KL79_9BACI|nr:YaiI/YqxD family protein [Shouchella lonarensis]SDC31687.1 hypothetical protein SAMN05421737_10767 [Shouchella lonarensis]
MGTKRNQIVYVDADSCPVKEEIISLCETYECDVVFVCSYAHDLNAPAHIKIVQVDCHKEAVDLYILAAVKETDVCVTQDYGLASLLLMKGVYVVSPRGHRYDEKTMDEMLQSRYLSQKERRSGKKVRGGPKKFTAIERDRFKQNLASLLDGE